MSSDLKPKSSNAAVIDGVMQYTSPSQIQTADVEGRPDKACLRRWYYSKVLRRKEPQGKGAALGEKFHGEIETYSKTGDLVLSDRAMALRPLIQPAGPLWHVEYNVSKTSGYEISGVPVTMKLDVVNLTRKRWDIDKSAWVLDDSDVLLEIKDWKTSKDVAAYALTSDEVGEDNQMVIYGDFGRKTYAHGFTDGFVRLTHVYLQTEGKILPPDVRSKKVSLDVIDEKMEDVTKVVDAMKEVAKLPSVNDVPANRAACFAFGGCPHRSVCPKTASEQVSSFLKPKAGKVTEELEDVSNFLDMLSDPELTEKVVADHKTFAADGKGTPQYVGDAAKIVAESQGYELSQSFSGLAGSGERAKEVVGWQNANKPSNSPDDMQNLAEKIVSVTTKDMAKVFPVGFKGINPPDTTADGGPLAAEPIPQNDLPSLPPEIVAAAKAGGWVEALALPTSVNAESFEDFAKRVGRLPTSAMAASEEPAPKARKKRRSKAEIEAEKASLTVPVISNTIETPEVQAATKETLTSTTGEIQEIIVTQEDVDIQAGGLGMSIEECKARYPVQFAAAQDFLSKTNPQVTFIKDEPRMMLSGIHLLVDVSVEKLGNDLGKVNRLEPIIEAITDELARLDGSADILIGKEGGFLGFGKWKGALKAKIREAVEAKSIPAGVYTVRCFGDEVLTVAVKELARYADTVVFGRGGV